MRERERRGSKSGNAIRVEVRVRVRVRVRARIGVSLMLSFPEQVGMRNNYNTKKGVAMDFSDMNGGLSADEVSS